MAGKITEQQLVVSVKDLEEEKAQLLFKIAKLEDDVQSRVAEYEVMRISRERLLESYTLLTEQYTLLQTTHKSELENLQSQLFSAKAQVDEYKARNVAMLKYNRNLMYSDSASELTIEDKSKANEKLHESNMKAIKGLTNVGKGTEQCINENQLTANQNLLQVEKDLAVEKHFTVINRDEFLELKEQLKKAENYAFQRLSDFNKEVEKNAHLISKVYELNELQKSSQQEIAELEKTVLELKLNLFSSQLQTKEWFQKLCPSVPIDSSVPFQQWLLEFEKQAISTTQSAASESSEFQVDIVEPLQIVERKYLPQQHDEQAVAKKVILPELTLGSINRILNGDNVSAAIIQILSYRKVPNVVKDIYRFIISDGGTSYRFAILSARFNSLVTNKELETFTIVHVDKYVCHQVQPDRIVIILLDLTVLTPGVDVGEKLGNPVDSSATSTNAIS